MEAFIDQFGYLAVGALIFIENVFPPIPSEVILPLSGFLTTTSHLTLPGVILAATAGSVLGAFILYGVGRIISRERLVAFFETRPMRLLGFTGADVERVIDWFERRGQLSVLLCRCVPGVRSLISIPAGTARMGTVRFTLYTLAGSFLWNTVLCGLGAAAGDAWHGVADSVAWASDALKVVVVLLLVVGVCWWVVRRAIPAWRQDRAA
ncbi:DedA family protein [Atopobiaceae bacterium 24-176]